MGLLIGLIVNSILLSIPIGSSLGALFAIRPFRNEIVPEPVDYNHIIVTSICGEFHEFTENKMGLNYTGELWDMDALYILFGMLKHLVLRTHCGCHYDGSYCIDILV
jgi:hypothetical protein